MRAIVTGGAGFIGSTLVDALVARGDEVVVVDDLSSGFRENLPEDVRLAELDVADPAVAGVFDEVRPEVCFHLAAQADVRVSVERPEHDARVNVLGTIRILEVARRHGTQVVFSSTGGAIYGECPEPAAETAERRPLAPYAVAKLAGEEYLAAYNRLHGTNHVSLRYGNVYGPRQQPHGEAGVVAIFLGRLARGQRPVIFGDGGQTRDYVFVDDTVRATLAAVGHDDGTFNVGTGREISVLELFETCRRVTAVDVEPKFVPARLGEIQRSSLDPALAGRELGWQPQVSLGDGLQATWDWIKTLS